MPDNKDKKFLNILLVAVIAAGVFYSVDALGDESLPTVQSGMSAEEIDALAYPSETSAWHTEALRILETGPRYLPADLELGTAQPASNTSAETRAELDALLKMQEEERSADQVDKIEYENRYEGTIHIFSDYGLYDAASHPETVRLLDQVIEDVTYFLVREKKHFNRARPSQLEPKLTTVIPVPLHAAYPSGHAGQGYAQALVLGMLDPAHKDAYETLAKEIAHRREVAGVHYASDSEAGFRLAETVVTKLMEQKLIAAQYALAQEEWANSEKTNLGN